MLRLLAMGYSNEAIAEMLCLTVRTVEYHMTNVLRKLGVGSRLEAAVWVHDCLPKELHSELGIGKNRGEKIGIFADDRTPKMW